MVTEDLFFIISVRIIIVTNNSDSTLNNAVRATNISFLSCSLWLVRKQNVVWLVMSDYLHESTRAATF